MFNYEEYEVKLACGSTDLRKSINGLCDIVMTHFTLDPREKTLFGFCNKRRNLVKILVWEDNGFWLHLKRFERGRMIWPEFLDEEVTMKVSYQDFYHLLKAPGISQKIKRKEVWKKP
jgi:transposase